MYIDIQIEHSKERVLYVYYSLIYTYTHKYL